jgi:hypothetical protein
MLQSQNWSRTPVAERYRRSVQRRDEQEFRIQDGCLVLADGRLPAVRDITDPMSLGVHRAADLADPAPGGRARPGAPAYVPRDVDGELRGAAGGGRVRGVGRRFDSGQEPDGIRSSQRHPPRALTDLPFEAR